ncbi:hypothetical protein ACOMHN_015196 [Nucella lapillus]
MSGTATNNNNNNTNSTTMNITTNTTQPTTTTTTTTTIPNTNTTQITNTNTTYTNNNNNNTTSKPSPININITLQNGNESTGTLTSSPPPLSSSMTSVIASGGTTIVSGAGTTVVGQSNTWLGLSMSNTLLITVFSGCIALILFVLCVICCRLLCLKNRRESTTPTGDRLKRQPTRQQSNHYAVPRVMENHYHSNDVTKLYATPELNARPQIYSTFINPSFYEDVYARWKLQEQARFDTYEHTHQYSRQLKDQMDTQGFKWSANSLRALDNYDYETYGKIPRGKVTSGDTDGDDAETVTMETTPELSTF